MSVFYNSNIWREIANTYPVPLELGGHDNVARKYKSTYMLHFL